MPETLVATEMPTLPKSLSDSEVLSAPLPKSSSIRGLFIEEMGSRGGRAGDRVWILLAHRQEETVEVALTNGAEDVPAEDVVDREKLITFTVPELPWQEGVSLSLTAGNSHIAVPFEYTKRRCVSMSPSVSLDNLVEFATTGDTISLLQPFANLISNADSDGNTVLHVAARSSQSYALKALLSVLPTDSKKGVVNSRNSRGQTALHCAIRTGDPDSVHYLKNHGAGSDVADNHNNTAVHYLADAYNEAIFKEILEPADGQMTSLETMNDEGLAPLHLAVRRLKLSLIEMLLESGACLEASDRSGRTALSHAVIMNDPEIIQLLVQRGANVNVEDSDGTTPLLIAKQNANYAVLGLLLDAGGDAKKKNAKGEALEDCEDETVQKIIAGERIALPPKEVSSLAPSDLPASRPTLFGRARPLSGPSSAHQRVIIRPSDAAADDEEDQDVEPVATSRRRSSIDRLADEVHEMLEDIDQPSTSSSIRHTVASSSSKAFSKDDISCLDYLTRLRLSKLLDVDGKWEMLARELNCEHMIELIGICSDEDSSPSMILLDQFEQMAEAKISSVRGALDRLGFTEATTLLDDRFVY